MDRGQLQTAFDLHARGEVDRAAALYRAFLVQGGEHAGALHGLALIEAGSGNFEEAVRLLRSAVRLAPGDATLQGNLGNALRQTGALAAAVDAYDAAVRLQPQYALGWINLGATLNELGRHEAAVHNLQRAIALQPDHPDAHFNLGNAMGDLGRDEQALQCYERAVALAPDFAPAWINRGAALARLGRRDEALGSYDRALALAPDWVPALCGRADVLADVGRVPEALAAYRRAVDLGPADAHVLAQYGSLLELDGRHPEAEHHLRRALEIRPEDARSWASLAATLSSMKRHREALAACERALGLQANLDLAAWNAAVASLELGRHAGALDFWLRAGGARAAFDDAQGLGYLAMAHLCEWGEIEAIRDTIADGIRQDRRVAVPFVAQAAGVSLELQRRCAEIAVGDLPLETLPNRTVAAAGTPLRIGYVSGDFREHPVGHQVAGLLRHHDRARFELIGLSLRRDTADPRQAEIAAAFDRFLDLSGMPDRDAIDLARRLELDVALDLQGHTDGARPRLFAERIAPLQANLFCPGTSGLRSMDYLLGDAVVTPLDQAHGYSERIVHLPGSFFLCDHEQLRAGSAASRSAQGLPPEGFVFACFCEAYKLGPALWDAWMALLREVPGSVLWTGVRKPDAVRNLRREAEVRGVSADRVCISPFAPSRSEHVSRLALADLCLDTVPYNGHTTTADALWAGVPVLATTGPGFAGRVSASLLHAIGLPELVFPDLAGCMRAARELAADPARLAGLRNRLAGLRASAPLFDAPRTVRGVEEALQAMTARARSGLAPAPFAVCAD